MKINEKLEAVIASEFGGNATFAMLEIGRHYGIAIAYMRRDAFEELVSEHRGDDRPLTDGEWDTIKSSLDEYDNFVDNTRGPTERLVPSEFIRHLLQINFIEPPAPDDPWESESDKDPGFTGGW